MKRLEMRVAVSKQRRFGLNVLVLGLALLLGACEESLCEDAEYESAFAVKTCLGGGADELASLSPSLKEDLQTLEKDGWKVRYDPGGGSYATRDEKIIIIDSALQGSPPLAVQTLAHEVGHALSPFEFDYSSKSAFVSSALTDEGAATLNNIKVQREILNNGGADIGLAGQDDNHPIYQQIYDKYLQNGDFFAAARAIGAEFGLNERTSVTGQVYNDYYGDWYDRHHRLRGWRYTQSGWRTPPGLP